MKYYIGIDIGGTKIAVILSDTEFNIIERAEFPTAETAGPEASISRIFEIVDRITEERNISIKDVKSFGISCGGPLSSKRGIIMSPPNLPGWDSVEIVRSFEERYGRRTYLQNDANACAAAEWKRGAGRGYENVIFLTFGTGMGAGLILDGRLYSGVDDMAGEVGHIRLEEDGPTGYGKRGSFEGFCSGGGIARLGEGIIERAAMEGYGGGLIGDLKEGLTTKRIAQRAYEGDETALEIIEKSAENLGRGLSILVDILNPEVIVLGSIFTRCEDLFRRRMEEVMERECLGVSLRRCQVVPAQLGETIGDYGALVTASGEY